MSNQIRLKRGSGSDPSADDLVVGEIAIRTDEGKLFTKKDDGSVAEISGGGIDDGDKGDITVSNSGGTFTVDNGVISTGKLADNAVTMAKLQDLDQNRIFGRIASGSGNPTALTAANVRTMINVENGATADQTASDIKTLLQSDKLTASEIADGQINSAKIVNGTIVNADINASAAIATSKIAGLATSATTDTTNASNISSGTLNTARLPTFITHASQVTIQSTGSGNDVKLDAADFIILEAGEEEDGGILFRGNSGADSYRFSKSGQHTIEGFLSFESLSADRTFTFPDTAGTLALTSDIPTNNNQLTNGAGFITATLTNEQVQDIVGDMVVSNTESGITVQYSDSAGKLNFTVASQTDQNFTTTLKNKLDGIASGATNVTNTNQLTNGAGFLTSVGTSNISDNSVTLAKLEDLDNGRIIARVSSGFGSPQAATASQIRSILNVEDGATADQSASEILTLLKTVDGAGSGLDADTLDNISSGSFLRSDADDTFTGQLTVLGRLDIGNGGGNDHEIRIYKADNNVSDHIQFYNGTTRVGEIGVEDNTWLRINQETNKNIYTPRYIRADGGFFVDGTSKGINGSGNFIGGTIAGASDYSTLLRSNADDVATGNLSFAGTLTCANDVLVGGGAGALTVAANSDIRFGNGSWTGNPGGTEGKIQMHSENLYIVGGNGGIRFREGGTDRWAIDGSGHFVPSQDSTYDIGSNSNRVSVGYFDVLDSGRAKINNGILETNATIADSHTLTSGFNAMAVSPTINNGVTITVPSGAVWAIV